MSQRIGLKVVAFAFVGALCAGGVAYAADNGPIARAGDTAALLKEATAGSWRSDANKVRDQYRHPVETLTFFGLRPGMTVIELDPGGGWYTEILAPFLYANGHLIEATSPPRAGRPDRFGQKLKSDPKVSSCALKQKPTT